MKRRTAFWGVTAVLLVVSVVGLLFTVFGSHTLTFRQAELQQKVDAKLPYTTAKHNVTVNAATVDLSGDRIGLVFEAETTKMGQDFKINAGTTGTLRYDVEEGSFYFTPATLEMTNFEVNDKVFGRRFGQFLDRHLSSALSERRQQLADWAKAETTEKIQSASEAALARVPVYTLKNDFKGNIARMTITNVEVKDSTLVVHLSFLQLTGFVLLYALLFVAALAFAVALVLNPEIGMVVIAFSSWS